MLDESVIFVVLEGREGGVTHRMRRPRPWCGRRWDVSPISSGSQSGKKLVGFDAKNTLYRSARAAKPASVVNTVGEMVCWWRASAHVARAMMSSIQRASLPQASKLSQATSSQLARARLAKCSRAHSSLIYRWRWTEAQRAQTSSSHQTPGGFATPALLNLANDA